MLNNGYRTKFTVLRFSLLYSKAEGRPIVCTAILVAVLTCFGIQLIIAPNVDKTAFSISKQSLNLRQYAWHSLVSGSDNHRHLSNNNVKCFRHVTSAGDYPHKYIWAIAKEMFPECGGYATPLFSLSSAASAPSNSLLFYPESRQLHILKEYPGIVLFFKEEPAGKSLARWNKQRKPNWYSLGHAQDSNTTVYFPVLAQRVAALNAEDRSKVFVPMLRPKNTGKHFLIYAQTHRIPFRENAFNQLASIDVVHWGGLCNGDTGRDSYFCARGGEKNPNAQVQESPYRQEQKYLSNGSMRMPVRERQQAVRRDFDNRFAYSDYRFALVMENRNAPGYITEKILFAFLGGSIPIWYGTTDIFSIINKDAFIYYDIENPKPALKLIRNLEKNHTAYMHMLSQPILADGAITIEQYFSASDDIGGGSLKKKVREMVGCDVES